MSIEVITSFCPRAGNFYLALKPTLQIDVMNKHITTMHTQLVEKGVEGLDLFDVEAAEKAEAQIDQFITKRAREREEVNRIEAAWAESERRVVEKRRETNRQRWIDYFEHMHRLHLGIAAEHANRRSRLMLEVVDEPEDGPPEAV